MYIIINNNVIVIICDISFDAAVLNTSIVVYTACVSNR